MACQKKASRKKTHRIEQRKLESLQWQDQGIEDKSPIAAIETKKDRDNGKKQRPGM